jgi:hypothetical protein
MFTYTPYNVIHPSHRRPSVRRYIYPNDSTSYRTVPYRTVPYRATILPTYQNFPVWSPPILREHPAFCPVGSRSGTNFPPDKLTATSRRLSFGTYFRLLLPFILRVFRGRAVNRRFRPSPHCVPIPPRYAFVVFSASSESGHLFPYPFACAYLRWFPDSSVLVMWTCILRPQGHYILYSGWVGIVPIISAFFLACKQ